jgi:hypothetical protein
MRCSRCKGQMNLEDFQDIRDDTGKFSFQGWRCLICGEVFDPIIQAHRKQSVPPMNSRVSKKKIHGVGVN